MERALCRQLGGDLFFPRPCDEVTPGQGSHITNHLPPEARKACELCPVTQQCLSYALEHEIEFGVWGGTSAAYRIKLRRERQSAEREAQGSAETALGASGLTEVERLIA